jgi:hypothetical protein
MLSVVHAGCHKQVQYAECRYAECRYAECRYAECRYAECRYAECRYAECHFAECRGTTAVVIFVSVLVSRPFQKTLMSQLSLSLILH